MPRELLHLLKLWVIVCDKVNDLKLLAFPAFDELPK